MAMTLKETLAQLESLGNEKRRAHNRRSGAGDNQFGVELGQIRKLAAKIKTSHPFAIALWDRKRQRLILARDRVGIRPLFVQRDGSRLLFDSEVKSILAVSGQPRDIEQKGLGGAFRFWGTGGGPELPAAATSSTPLLPSFSRGPA